VGKIGQKLNEYERQGMKWKAAAMSFERDEEKLKEEIEEWKSKAGTTCPTCKQDIKEGHVLEQCKPLDAEIGPLVGRIGAAKQEYDNIVKLTTATKEKLQGVGPKQQISEAEAVVREAKRVESQIVQIGKDIQAVKSELNPYGPIIARAKKELATIDSEMGDLNGKVDTYNFVLKHLQYIFSVYNDKKKLKSFMLGDLVPFLNDRVSYYLKAFGCDFDLKFTATLQDVTSRWDYEFCSGGERKRIDLAVMFAFYDLYVAIYGLQCNLLVLDEVDGRLDSVGVQAFVDVIEKDFAKKDDKSNRPDAVFVISHKDEMRDAFPSKIRIVKEGGFSKVAEA
jgi:DNA repair exonuclease SbcCD ATPase subunit